MTVAKLLIFVVTLTAFLAAVALGYVWVQDRQAAAYALPYGPTATPIDMLIRYGSAPPLVCTAEMHSFQVNAVLTMFVYQQKIRLHVVKASGLIGDVVIDASGAYTWNEQGSQVSDVYHEPPDGGSTLFDYMSHFANVTWDSCKPWWNPDNSMFAIPTAAIVHETR